MTDAHWTSQGLEREFAPGCALVDVSLSCAASEALVARPGSRGASGSTALDMVLLNPVIAH